MILIGMLKFPFEIKHGESNYHTGTNNVAAERTMGACTLAVYKLCMNSLQWLDLVLKTFQGLCNINTYTEGVKVVSIL